MKSSSRLKALRSVLPFIGPASNLVVFPSRNPDAMLKKLKGNERLFCTAELAIARCEFARARELAEELLEDEHYVFAAVRICLISAIGLGDFRFFDKALKSLEDYRKRALQPASEVGFQITEAWIRQWLLMPDGYPEWMWRFNMKDIPEPWRRSAAYLGVKIRVVNGAFESAYAASSLFLNFICPTHGITAACAYSKIACAISCRETNRKEEMRQWLCDAIRTLAPHGILLPFLLFMVGTRKSPVEEILAEVAPEQLPRYRGLSQDYFRNLIRARNRYTGERTTENLTSREFYLAMLLKRNLSYKELADKFEISIGRVRNLVSILYEKLHIHGKAELSGLVW